MMLEFNRKDKMPFGFGIFEELPVRDEIINALVANRNAMRCDSIQKYTSYNYRKVKAELDNLVDARVIKIILKDNGIYYKMSRLLR
jgi:hypothetical protein